MLLVMAAIALGYGQASRSSELIEAAGKIGGAEGWRQVLLARIALQKGDTKAARAHAQAAVGHELPHPAIAGELGVLLARTGLHALSLPLFERAAKATPNDGQTAYNLGIARQFAGDLAGARDVFRALVARDPAHARAWLALVQLDRQADPDLIPALEGAFASAAERPARRVLGHAIAKVLEDLGRWDESFAWLERAKAERTGSPPHDRTHSEAIFAAAHRSTELAIADTPSGDEAPIFIVGLPRSGTTLVERIVSAHPAVRSAGELSDFAVLLKRRLATPGPRVLDPATILAGMEGDLAGIDAAYIARVRSIVEDAPRFIDKMPFNFFFVPLILKALPGARIILLRRSPFDAVFSNYRQLFANGFTYYSYAEDFEDTAAFVASFETLADHYAATLPPARFMAQRYEDIVADVDSSAHRLIDFLGLDWDPACLAFHENAAPVATASSVQVRRPIYGSAVERWRRYGPASERLVALMAERGIHPPGT